MPGEIQEYEVILTWEAIYDVTDITDYIEAEFGQDRADRFQKDIKKEMEKLGYIGGGFPKTRILYRNYTIHKKPFPPSIIFYILMDEKKEVHVLRVLRDMSGKKDVSRIFCFGERLVLIYEAILYSRICNRRVSLK